MNSMLRKLNLFQRLLLYFFIVIMVPLFLVTSITYKQASQSIQEQSEVYLDNFMDNVHIQVENFVHKYELITLPLVLESVNHNSQLSQFLQREFDREIDRYQTYQALKQSLVMITTQNPDIDLMYIITNTGKLILSEDRYYSPNEPFPIESVYKELNEVTPDSGTAIIHSWQHLDNSGVITIARKLKGSDFKPKGILGINIKVNHFSQLWSANNLGSHSIFMILDQTDKIIYHPDPQMYGQWVPEPIENALNQADQGSFFAQWNGNHSFFRYSTVANTNWKLVTVVPAYELYEPISGLRSATWISISAALMLALFLALSFIRGIIRPIRMLQNRMKKMEEGVWVKVPYLEGNDEISHLMRSYNHMIKKITHLVEKVYKAELKNQRAEIELKERELERHRIEFQALQYQINPHFLYNTLETINAYALLKGVDDISEMADSLAYMFRYTLKSLQTVKIVKELDHVRNYLIIQEHRMKKKIPFEVHIDPKWLLEDVVKLTLQPLVENAIQHGITGSSEDQIVVDAKVEGHVFIVTVEDNGRGMKPERLEEVRRSLHSQNNEIDGSIGIGLHNVHRRIQLLFGEHYGLHIESVFGSGTKITMRMPSMTNRGEGMNEDDQKKHN